MPLGKPLSLHHRLSSHCIFPEIDGWTIVRGVWGGVVDRRLRAVWKDEFGSLVIEADGETCAAQAFFLTFADVAQFDILFASREIVARPFNEDISGHTIRHLLVDQIWPRVLAHNGALVLHASGVATGEGALLFVGHSGRGKSTLAASLHQRGLPLIGDDAVLIDGLNDNARCKAVYRSLRLFADSIETLFDPTVDQSDVADYTDKRNIHFPVLETADASHPVRAIFFISPESDDASARVNPVSPGDACMRLVEHNFWLDPTDMAKTTRKLHQASVLATRVPAWKLDYPRDFSKLDDLQAAIFSVLA